MLYWTSGISESNLHKPQRNWGYELKGMRDQVIYSGITVLRLLGRSKFVASITRHSRVWLSRFIAYGILVLCAALPISHSVQSAPTASSSSVWFVVHKTLRRIDAVTHEQQAEVFLDKEIEALAVDGADQSVWVLGEKTLRKFDSQLIPILSIELKDLRKAVKVQSNNEVHLEDGEKIIADAFSGDVWLIGEKGVVILNRGGALQASYRTDNKIEDFTLALNQHAWLLTKKTLIEIDAGGSVIRSTNIKGIVKDPERLAIDSLANVVWVAGKKELYRFNATNLNEAPVAVTLPAASRKKEIKAEAIAIDPVSGVAWLAGEHDLRVFNRSGKLLFERDIKADGIKEAEILSWDPVSGTLYIGGEKTLSQYRLDGTLVWQIPMDKKLRALGTAPFSISPVVSIVAPPDGAFTNNSRATINLKLGAQCNSAGCESLGTYLDSLAIQSTLDDNSIGSNFVVGGGGAVYLPLQDYSEGSHEIIAKAIDRFGHISNTANSAFVLDTVAPTFESIAPNDGTVLSNPAVTITAKAVDTSPTTITLQASDGTVLSLGGADFNHTVTLEPGLNEFTLVAQDAAGNETVAQLRLTVSTLSINITEPADNSAVTENTLVVRGVFDAPANSGITVNGVIAQKSGQSFVALVPLINGSNILTARIATLEGDSADDTVTVVNTPSSGTGTGGVDVIILTSPTDAQLTINTIVGTGTPQYGGDGQPGLAASLYRPFGIAAAADGSMYIADMQNHRIRRVAPNGVVSTVAGTGVPGYYGDGGLAVDAQLYNPAGITVGADGTLYISDSSNHRIRKVDSNGIITTVAGSGISGYLGDGGQAVDARIALPQSIALASDGSFYIADFLNHRIRYVGNDGIITTVAGSGSRGFSGDGGQATSAELNLPQGVLLDSSNQLFIADSYNHRVRKVDTAGVITTVAGSGATWFTDVKDNGLAIWANLNRPRALAMTDDGTLYIVDSGNHRVRKVSPAGIISTVTGVGSAFFGGAGFQGDGGPAIEGWLNYPTSMAILANNDVVIADSDNHRIRKLSKPVEGVVPQEVMIDLDEYGDITVTQIDVDFDGDGNIDYTTTNISSLPIVHTYSEAGGYPITVIVYDADGNKYVHREIIVVENENEKDDLLKLIFHGMLEELKAGNLDGATLYLSEGAKREYKPVFKALLPHMAEIISSYSDLQRVSLSKNIGEYAINRTISGKNHLFLIYFLKDADGIWRLDAM